MYHRKTLCLISLVWFLSFGGSCQLQNAVQGRDDPKATSPPPSQSPPHSLDRSAKQFINDDGWPLPALSSFTEKSKKEFKKDTTSRIEQEEYVPVGDVIQSADGNTFGNLASDSDIEKKSWLIRYLKVFSADGRPFCYVMRGNLVDVDSTGKVKERLAMSIVLVYSDRDGDGRFETFEYSSSEAPLIPARLKKR